jgi:hypothetical protein
MRLSMKSLISQGKGLAAAAIGSGAASRATMADNAAVVVNLPMAGWKRGFRKH